MAKVLQLSPTPSPEIIQEASSCIHGGGVLSVATESSYALAAGVWHPQAIQRVVSMKGDRQAKPILLLISERTQLSPLVSTMPSAAERLMNHFWPGPLTLVLPAAPHLSDLLTCGTGTIGVRQPNEPRLLVLVRATGPVTGTSANRSGEEPLQKPGDVVQLFGDHVDMILDSGPSPGGWPSTVLSLVGEPRLLRKGPISAGAIQKVIGGLGLTLQESIE